MVIIKLHKKGDQVFYALLKKDVWNNYLNFLLSCQQQISNKAVYLKPNHGKSIFTGVIYDINEDVQKVLNAYVNAVGVRVTLTEAGVAAVDQEHYAYGKADKADFFEVTAAKDGNKYTVTITPKKNVVLDEASMKANLRVNNNHSALAEALETLTIADGVATFTITVE